MKFDIVIVTFNSASWINRCIQSLSKVSCNLSDLSIFFVDNNSKDKSVRSIEDLKIEYKEKFNSISIIQNQKNLGFGKANNLGARHGFSPYIFFLNVDTEIEEDAFNELERSIIDSTNDVRAWECRQFPFEHPKLYNPVTLQTSWCSGACFVVERNTFIQMGGFDETFFMYAEDVDISWRLRSFGYNLKYVPKAIVNHYAYKNSNEVKPLQYFYGIINNLRLRFKFGSFFQIAIGHLLFLKVLIHKGPVPRSRLRLVNLYILLLLNVPSILFSRTSSKKHSATFLPKFIQWDYELIREGAFHKNERKPASTKVSILTRTCNRPEILREALTCIRNQTYTNIESIVIEDGESTAERVIKEDFNDLNLKYYHSKVNVGRCRCGNIALSHATGDYFIFLDDDDVIFADHIEILVNALQTNQNYHVAYSYSYETPIKILSNDPYRYIEVFHNLIHRQSFNRLLLFHHNFLPIQQVMFHNKVYQENGGFDESLNVLEDWDLWVRYSLKNDFLCIPKVTSMYRVPFNKADLASRQVVLDNAIPKLRAKHLSYHSQVAVANCADDLQNILDSYIVKIHQEVMIRKKQTFLSIILKAYYGINGLFKK